MLENDPFVVIARFIFSPFCASVGRKKGLKAIDECRKPRSTILTKSLVISWGTALQCVKLPGAVGDGLLGVWCGFESHLL